LVVLVSLVVKIFRELVLDSLLFCFGVIFMIALFQVNQADANDAQSKLAKGAGQAQSGHVNGVFQNTNKKLDLNKNDHNVDGYQPPQLDGLFPSSDGLDGGDDANDVTVLIRSIVIEGGTVFSKADFSACYGSIVGQSIVPQQLVDLSVCMTKIYTDAGYPLSRVVLPPQDIPNGLLRVQIIEGYISSFKIMGGDAARFNIAPFMNVMMQQRPLTQKLLERQLMLISDIPGIDLNDTALEETSELSGAYQLTLEIETSRYYSNGEIDNRGTDDIGPYQSFNSVFLYSLFGAGESIGLSYSSIPFESRELQFGRLSLDVPLDAYGLRFSASVSASSSRPSDFRKIFDTTYENLLFNSQLEWTIERERDFSLWGGIGVWVSRNEWENEFGRFVNDDMAGLSLTGRSIFNDKLGGENYILAELRQGFDVGGATRKGDAEASRVDGDGVFTKLTIDYIRQQSLNKEWSVKFDGSVQLANRGLLTGEEFYLGGYRFGRAFESGIIGGDSGLGASLELQYTREVDMPFLNGVQLYGFVDLGWIFKDGNDFIEDTLISSAGAGARFYFSYGLSAEVEVAFPLDDGGFEDVDDVEFFFKVSRNFALNELSVPAFLESTPFASLNQ